MSQADLQYNQLIDFVLSKGRRKKNRTGTDTIGAFGAQVRFDLSEGFPLLTTKKVYMRSIIHELLWFLKGDRNIKYLVDNNVNIWNGNCYARYKQTAPWAFGATKDFFKYGTVGNHEWPTPEIAEKMKAEHPDSTGYRGLGPYSKEEFVEKIRDDEEFARQCGDLGEGTYGGMWRAFPYEAKTGEIFVKGDVGDGQIRAIKTSGYVDQIQKVIDKLKTNPDDRRLIVSAWHPYWVDHCALPPCHVLFQFHTEELTVQERWKESNRRGFFAGVHYGFCGTLDGSPSEVLDNMNHEQLDRLGVPRRRLNCQLYQRSADLFLGVPFNIASYALLTIMMAQVAGMVPGEFVHTFGDIHIYVNHLDQIKEQRQREPKTAPKLQLNPEVKDLFGFKYEDIKLLDYDSHPALKGEMAV